MALALAVALSTVALGSLAQGPSSCFTPRTASEGIAVALASDRDATAGPSELYLVAADLFARSYFLDLLPYPSWSPEEALWKAQYPLFLEFVISNALPRDTPLATFLASEMTKRMSAEQLLELRAKVCDPKMRAAVKRLQAMGVNLRFVLLAERDPKVMRLYSREERADAKHTIDVMRGALPEFEHAKPEREALVNFLESEAYKRYQAVVGDAFLQTVGRLEADKARFSRMLALWKVYLADQKR
jgi:hypothetical protein